ncbi:MAG: hypothetical protein ACYC27_12940 [Armatimonadota bacterium]
MVCLRMIGQFLRPLAEEDQDEGTIFHNTDPLTPTLSRKRARELST